MGENRKNTILQEFSDEVFEFIIDNKLEDKSENLIFDYIAMLYKKGIDLTKRDAEKEVYVFYDYHNKLLTILNELGEEKFLDLITDEEIIKNKPQQEL